MATGAVVAAMSSRRRSRLGWLSLTWTIRSLPVSRAISKVFLAVHGVEREYAAAQPQRGDQGLHRRDFVRLLVDDLVGENDLMVDGECAEDVRRLAVREGVKTLPQRVDRDGPHRVVRDDELVGRSLARAEHTSRMLDGVFQASLQGRPDDPSGVTLGWRSIRMALDRPALEFMHARVDAAAAQSAASSASAPATRSRA